MTTIYNSIWKFHHDFAAALFQPAPNTYHRICHRGHSHCCQHTDTEGKKEYSTIFLNSIQGQFVFVSRWITSLGLDLWVYKQGMHKSWVPSHPKESILKGGCLMFSAWLLPFFFSYINPYPANVENLVSF
jgi:hypothetical protein